MQRPREVNMGQLSWWGWQSRLREEQELRLLVGGMPGEGTSGDPSHRTAWLPNPGPDTPTGLLSLPLDSVTLTHPAHSWCDSDFENRIHSFNTSKIGAGIYPAAKKKKKKRSVTGPTNICMVFIEAKLYPIDFHLVITSRKSL